MNLTKLKEELESKKKVLDILNQKRKKIYEESDKLEKEIDVLKEEYIQKTNYKIWKEMFNKYYHVWLFTISEEDKFKKCQYYHILKVENDCLEYEYINIDDTSKNSNYIVISKYDFIHERGYKEWTEITEKEYKQIIKSKNPKRIE